MFFPHYGWTLMSCWLASLLRCPESTALVRVPSPTLSAPFSSQLSFRVPLPLPDTARFQVQKPFVWFRAKTDKGIVCLAGHPHSVTPPQLLITPFRLNKHNFSTSLAAPKANPIFHATNKNLFIKTPFDYRHLSSSSFYLYLPLNLSEGTNNTKRGNNST